MQLPTTTPPTEVRTVPGCAEQILLEIERRQKSERRAKSSTVSPMPPQPMRRRDFIAVALACGLIAGCVESLHWAVKGPLLGEFTYLPADVFWMSPVAYAVLFGPLGLAVAAVVPRVRHPAGPLFAVVALVLAGTYCALMIFGWLHVLARLVMAVGAAVQAGRWFERDRARAMGWIQFVAITLGGLVAVLAVVQPVSRSASESRALAGLPAASADAPNVLLIVLDTLRADAFSTYGAPNGATPRLDDLAQRGVLFEDAMSTASWTLPATASLMTGRMPGELTADWLTPLDATHLTLAEYLRDRGYATAGFVANYKYATAETGLGRGFAHYEDHSHSPAEFVSCTALGRALFFSHALPHFGCYGDVVRKSAGDVNASFLDWSAEQSDRPWFAFLNYLDVHDPYAAPAPFNEHAPQSDDARSLLRFWWFLDRSSLTSDEARLAQQAYGDCVRYLDFEIGRLIDNLEARGDLSNTLIIVTADHGEHFGEHGLWLHGNSLYQPLLHVPLIAVWDGRIPAEQRIRTPVSTASIPSTLARLLGDADIPFPGRDLSTCWSLGPGSAPADESLFAEVISPPITPPCQGASPVFRGSLAAVRLGDFKYIRNEDGEEELYNVHHDPGESMNLVPFPEWTPMLNQLRAALDTRSAASD